jgi:serine phosphatase RsbU (regulator of sigma subunit)
VTLRKSTWIWLAILAAAFLVIAVDGESERLGALGDLAVLTAILAGCVIFWKIVAAAFRLVVRRLALRLAFSYFLIGIVPIPLLAALFAAIGYLLAHQIIATRIRAEVDTLAEFAHAQGATVPRLRVTTDGRVAASSVPWLKPGDDASWANDLSDPHPIIAADQVWIGIRESGAKVADVALIPIQDRAAPWLQWLADRTGYDVTVELGSGEETATGYQIKVRRSKENPDPDPKLDFVTPQTAMKRPDTFWNRAWLAGVYVDRAVAVIGKTSEEKPVVAFVGRTSPAVFTRQLFTQGVPEFRRVIRAVVLSLSGALLLCYLVALAIAFALVGALVRNVNRLTRAAEAISHGDFSVRVNSKSRDQIGDLARSFDGMAASIQKLLVETARKEKLEADLAVARAIQESFLPESGASWKGFHAVAHFEPAADLGGDYYDILPMPDGRTAVTIGDVSGHGLPTGLVAAAARASLASFIELGVPAPDAFVRLGHRSRRSRDSERRLYTTLALFAYDAARRVGTLTNAGHPAPYRVSGTRVERLALPALPIGLLPGLDPVYPSQDYAFVPGDRLVLFTDGVFEAANAEEEPFGYERLEALLSRGGGRPASELVQEILAAVAAHVGPTPLEDDRTLLILTFDAT